VNLHDYNAGLELRDHKTEGRGLRDYIGRLIESHLDMDLADSILTIDGQTMSQDGMES
jgi:hypothetical protein